jgi:hypothetical protein
MVSAMTEALVVGDVPLLPGPLYGLRTWRVPRDGTERLVGPQRRTPWSPGRDWQEATCPAGHDAPAPDCRCGIHAWHPRLSSAKRVLAGRFELPGIVEADGRIELHEEGFRAQRARPYAFVRLPNRNPHLIERLAGRYGAQILDLRRPHELLEICRERNLGLEEAVVEQLLGPDVIEEGRLARARSRRDDVVRVAAALAILASLIAIGAAIDRPGPQGDRDVPGAAGNGHVR